MENVCGEDSNYTCGDGKQGICLHKCSLNKDYCGDNGVCFYSYAEGKIACRLVFDSMQVRSMQRSGTEAIRTQIQTSKPKMGNN